MTDVFSTVPTAWLLAAEQAFVAGGPAVNLGAGVLKVGDGNGVVPTASAIIANGGVLHQVWQGPVNAAVVDSGNALQVNINCLIPTVDATGAEIGPFVVREFAIYDASGNLALVGTTNLPKTVSSSGMLTTLQWWACYAAAVANPVVVQPPSGSWPTLGQIQTAVAGLLSGTAPIVVTPSLQSSGWTNWLVSIARATLSALGIGRPATDAEFAAGASATDFAWPWPTLAQIKAALLNFLPLTGGTMTGFITLAADPTAVKHAATKQYVDARAPVTVNVGAAADVSLSNLVTTTVANLTGTSNANITVAASSLTVNVAGLYEIDFNSQVEIAYPSASIYWATASVLKNGASILDLAEGAYFQGAATSSIGLNGVRILHLNASDVLTFKVTAYAGVFSWAAYMAAPTHIDITKLA